MKEIIKNPEIAKVVVKSGSESYEVSTITKDDITPHKLYHSVLAAGIGTKIKLLELVANAETKGDESISATVTLVVESETVIEKPLVIKKEDSSNVNAPIMTLVEELTGRLLKYIVGTATFRLIA